MKSPAQPPGSTGSTTARIGLSRRSLLRKLVFALAAAPAFKLGETVARAERRRRNHRGHSNEIWIGHC